MALDGKKESVMKKVFVALAMVLVCFQCVSFAGSPAEDEKILSEERALSAKPQTIHGADDVLSIIRESSSGDKEQRQSPRSWYSTDTTVMNPLLGTTWIMNYRLTSIWSDILIFGTKATTTSDGYAYLSCSIQSSSDTCGVLYTDLPQGGQGFAVVRSGTTLTYFYFFKVEGNVATGTCSFKTLSTGTYSSDYPLTGIKWGGLPGDINGDGKMGLEEVIRLLQVVSGLRP